MKANEAILFIYGLLIKTKGSLFGAKCGSKVSGKSGVH